MKHFSMGIAFYFARLYIFSFLFITLSILPPVPSWAYGDGDISDILEQSISVPVKRKMEFLTQAEHFLQRRIGLNYFQTRYYPGTLAGSKDQLKKQRGAFWGEAFWGKFKQ